VDTAPEEEAIDVQAAIRELRELEAKRDEVRARLDGYLKALGYEE
jgi:type I restriction enzyme M protein